MNGPDSRRRAGTDAVTIALGYLTSFAYPLVSLPFLARVLGVADLGVVMLLLAVLQVVIHVTDFGFSISALRRASLARTVAERSQVLMETVWAKTLIWLVCTVVMIAVTLVVPGLHEHAGAMMLGLLLVLAGAWYPGWMLQAMGRMLTFALVMSLSRIIALGGLLLTVRDPAHMDLAVAWQLAPQALAAVITWWLLVRVWGSARVVWVTRLGVTTALRDSAPLFVSNATVVVTASTSSLALGAFAAPSQVAFFGAAERFGNAVRGVMRGVVDAMLPRMAAGNVAGMRRFVSLGVVAAYGTAGACLAIGAGWVIPWYLGADMVGAIWPTRLVGVMIMIAGITTVLTLHANAEHRYGLVARLTAIGAVVHVALCIPAVLWAGAVGATLALIVTETVMATLFLHDLLRRRSAGARGAQAGADAHGRRARRVDLGI
ncbi:lipopolysaccharide biosynthesis protein [Brachybacterium sp. GCM10030268]|uniref:lipopolysaccharide biosynthesis protein n=1 Tax=Brachybacterium sp. GCM10030268 TaxID=3273382 RepID=UPI00360E1DCD